MRGKFSKNKFFQKFPPLIQTYFLGSKSIPSEVVEKLFVMAENNLQFFNEKDIKKEELPISMILFDHMELVEKNKNNLLNILHYKLDNIYKDEGINFIGFSNYSIDSAIINRVLTLTVPDIEYRLDDLMDASESITKSISEDLSSNRIFQI